MITTSGQPGLYEWWSLFPAWAQVGLITAGLVGVVWALAVILILAQRKGE